MEEGECEYNYDRWDALEDNICWNLHAATMATLFCCSAIEPYRPARLDHEAKFVAFYTWASSQPLVSPSTASGERMKRGTEMPSYAVQLVRQVNYGGIESIRYFTPEQDGSGFTEVLETNLIEANFQKLNTYLTCSRLQAASTLIIDRYKNFRCSSHNKFFEVNLYQKDPINERHWRSNLARPGSSIDL